MEDIPLPPPKPRPSVDESILLPPPKPRATAIDAGAPLPPPKPVPSQPFTLSPASFDALATTGRSQLAQKNWEEEVQADAPQADDPRSPNGIIDALGLTSAMDRAGSGIAAGREGLLRGAMSIGNALGLVSPQSVAEQTADAQRAVEVADASGIGKATHFAADLAPWVIPGGVALGAANVAGNGRQDVLDEGGSGLKANLVGLARGASSVIAPAVAGKALSGVTNAAGAKVAGALGNRLGQSAASAITGAGAGVALPAGDAAISALSGETLPDGTPRWQQELSPSNLASSVGILSLLAGAHAGLSPRPAPAFESNVPLPPPKPQESPRAQESPREAAIPREPGPSAPADQPTANDGRVEPVAPEVPPVAVPVLSEPVAPELAPQPAEAPAPAANVVGFKTARGSQYSVDQAGRTTRSAVEQNGTSAGAKPASDRTVYVAPEVAKTLASSRATPDPSAFPHTTSPEVGLHPVELNADTFHVGNEITELTRSDANAETRRIAPAQDATAKIVKPAAQAETARIAQPELASEPAPAEATAETKPIAVKTSIGKSVTVRVDPTTNGETAGGVYHVGQLDSGKYTVFGRSPETTSPSKLLKSTTGAGQFRGLDDAGLPVRTWKTVKSQARLPEFDTAEQARAHAEDLKTINAAKFRQRAKPVAQSPETSAQASEALTPNDAGQSDLSVRRPVSLADRNAPRDQAAADAAAGKYMQAEAKVRAAKAELDAARAHGASAEEQDPIIQRITDAATEAGKLRAHAETAATSVFEPQAKDNIETLAKQAKARPESTSVADAMTTGHAGDTLDSLVSDFKRTGQLPEAKKELYRQQLKPRVEAQIERAKADRAATTDPRRLAEMDAEHRKLDRIAELTGSERRTGAASNDVLDERSKLRFDAKEKVGKVSSLIADARAGVLETKPLTAEQHQKVESIKAVWPNAELHFIPEASAKGLGVDGMKVHLKSGKDVILISDSATDSQLAETYGHEIFHHVVTETGGMDEGAFFDAVKSVYGEDRAVQMGVDSSERGYMSHEYEEHLADTAGKMYATDPAFRAALDGRAPTIGEKFRSFVQKIVDHIKAIKNPAIRAKLGESKFIREMVKMARGGEQGSSPLAREYAARQTNKPAEVGTIREAKRKVEEPKREDDHFPSAFKSIADALPEREAMSQVVSQAKYDAGHTDQLFDSTADKIDKLFSPIVKAGDLVGLATPANLSAIGQRAGISLARNTLLPSYIAAKSPDGKTIFDSGRAKQIDIKNIIADSDKAAAPLLKLSGDSLAKVNKVLEAQRLEKQYFTDEQLASDHKLAPAQVAAVKATKRVLDEGYDRQIGATWEAFDHAPVSFDDLKTEIRDAKGPDKLRLQVLLQEMQTLDLGKREGYVPLERVGDHKKIVVTAQGENGRETFYYTHTANELEFKRKLEEAHKEYGDRPGVRIITDRIRDRDTDSAAVTEQDLRSIAAEAGVAPAEVDKFLKAGVDNYFLARRFRRHWLHSKDIPGYSTDYQRSVAQYVTQSARSVAALRFKKTTKGAFDGLAASDRAAHDYWTSWQNHIFSPVRDLPGAKSAAFYYFLGLDPVAAAVNPLNVVTNTAPFLHAVTGGKAGSVLAKTAKASYDTVIAAMKGGLSTKLATKVADHLELNGDPELADAVREAQRNGVLHNMDISELGARANTPARGGLGRATDKTMRAIGKGMGAMFQATEQGGRVASFLAAYREAKAGHVNWEQAKKYGYQGDIGDPAHFASFVVDETQGVYGRVNRPQFFRDGKGVKRFASAFYTMRQWGVHQTHFMYKLAKNSGDVGSAAALAGMTVMLAAAGGIWNALPFGDALKTAVNGAWTLAAGAKRDVGAEMRRHFGKIGKLADEGAGGDIGRRVGVGNTVPAKTDAQSLLGPAYGAAAGYAEALGKVASTDPAAKFEGAATLAGGQAGQNIAKFLDIGGRGFETSKGTTLIPAAKMTATDKAAQLFGARTEHMHEAQQLNQDKQRLETAVTDLRSQYVNRATDLIDKHDNPGFSALIHEISDHNAQATKDGRFSEVIDVNGLRDGVRNELIQRRLGAENPHGVPKKVMAEMIGQHLGQESAAPPPEEDDGE